METQALERPETSTDNGEGDNGDDLTHFHCHCEPKLATCGKDLSGIPLCHGPVEADEVFCAICANTEFCPFCGRKMEPMA